MSREELNLAQDAIGPERTGATFEDLRYGMGVGGNVHVDAAEIPHYSDYPDDMSWYDLFPWTYAGVQVASAAYSIYDGAKSHWGTKFVLRRSKWSNVAFDVLFAVGILGVFMDTLVTVNNSYTKYGTLEGIERGSSLRQWAAVFKRVGVPFGTAIALTDVLDLTLLWATWYYGRKQRNLISLGFLAYYAYNFWSSWWGFSTSLTEDLAGLPLFFGQLTGLVKPRDFQGGGPQTVVGIA